MAVRLQPIPDPDPSEFSGPLPAVAELTLQEALHREPVQLNPLTLEEAKVKWGPLDDKLHPRWPKGTPGGIGGRFMKVGQRFLSGGKEWEIVQILNGHVYAQEASGKASQAELRDFVPKIKGKFPDEKGNPEPGIALDVEPAPPHYIEGGGKVGSNMGSSTVTIVDPTVDTASHDPSIPIPEDSPITEEEWLRFGRLEQLHYRDVQARMGKWKPNMASGMIAEAYTHFDSDTQNLVSSAYQSQYGGSSGWTISLTSMFKNNKGASTEKIAELTKKREKARELQAMIGDIYAWDLYNRTHSPDVAVMHGSKYHTPDEWQENWVEGDNPVFSGMSMSWHTNAPMSFSHKDAVVLIPLSIRHVVMSTFSGGPLKGGKTDFDSEREISLPFQMTLDPDKVLVISKSSIAGERRNWLEQTTNAQPQSGTLVETFRGALNGTIELDFPPPAPNVQMDDTSVEPPPPEAAEAMADIAKFLPGQKDSAIEPKDLSLDIPWAFTTDDGLPEATIAAESDYQVGDFMMGLKGTFYWIGPDPDSGFGLRYHKLVPVKDDNGNVVGMEFNGEHFQFEGGGANRYFKVKGNVKPPKVQREGVEYDPAAWAFDEGEAKAIGKSLVKGDKFKANGTAYELMEDPNGKIKVKIFDVENGKTGTINADYQAVKLIPAEGYIPPSQLKPAKGLILPYNGKKAVVTNVSKAGVVSVKPQGVGQKVVKIEAGSPELADLYDPDKLELTKYRANIGALKPGTLFQIGKGEQTIHPAVVIENDGTWVKWLDKDTGEFGHFLLKRQVRLINDTTGADKSTTIDLHKEAAGLGGNPVAEVGDLPIGAQFKMNPGGNAALSGTLTVGYIENGSIAVLDDVGDKITSLSKDHTVTPLGEGELKPAVEAKKLKKGDEFAFPPGSALHGVRFTVTGKVKGAVEAVPTDQPDAIPTHVLPGGQVMPFQPPSPPGSEAPISEVPLGVHFTTDFSPEVWVVKGRDNDTGTITVAKVDEYGEWGPDEAYSPEMYEGSAPVKMVDKPEAQPKPEPDPDPAPPPDKAAGKVPSDALWGAHHISPIGLPVGARFKTNSGLKYQVTGSLGDKVYARAIDKKGNLTSAPVAFDAADEDFIYPLILPSVSTNLADGTPVVANLNGDVFLAHAVGGADKKLQRIGGGPAASILDHDAFNALAVAEPSTAATETQATVPAKQQVSLKDLPEGVRFKVEASAEKVWITDGIDPATGGIAIRSESGEESVLPGSFPVHPLIGTTSIQPADLKAGDYVYGVHGNASDAGNQIYVYGGVTAFPIVNGSVDTTTPLEKEGFINIWPLQVGSPTLSPEPSEAPSTSGDFPTGTTAPMLGTAYQKGLPVGARFTAEEYSTNPEGTYQVVKVENDGHTVIASIVDEDGELDPEEFKFGPDFRTISPIASASKIPPEDLKVGMTVIGYKPVMGGGLTYFRVEADPEDENDPIALVPAFTGNGTGTLKYAATEFEDGIWEIPTAGSKPEAPGSSSDEPAGTMPAGGLWPVYQVSPEGLPVGSRFLKGNDEYQVTAELDDVVEARRVENDTLTGEVVTVGKNDGVTPYIMDVEPADFAVGDTVLAAQKTARRAFRVVEIGGGGVGFQRKDGAPIFTLKDFGNVALIPTAQDPSPEPGAGPGIATPLATYPGPLLLSYLPEGALFQMPDNDDGTTWTVTDASGTSVTANSGISTVSLPSHTEVTIPVHGEQVPKKDLVDGSYVVTSFQGVNRVFKADRSGGGLGFLPISNGTLGYPYSQAMFSQVSFNVLPIPPDPEQPSDLVFDGTAGTLKVGDYFQRKEAHGDKIFRVVTKDKSGVSYVEIKDGLPVSENVSGGLAQFSTVTKVDPADVPQGSGNGPLPPSPDTSAIPPIADAPFSFEPYKSPHSGAGVKYLKVGEMQEGTIFQDKTKRQFYIAVTGAEPVVTDGENYYRVGKTVRVKPLPNAIWEKDQPPLPDGVKPSVSNPNDPLGIGAAANLAAMKVMIPNELEITGADLPVGTIMDFGGSVWHHKKTEDGYVRVSADTGEVTSSVASGLASAMNNQSPSKVALPPGKAYGPHLKQPSASNIATIISEMDEGKHKAIPGVTPKIKDLPVGTIAKFFPDGKAMRKIDAVQWEALNFDGTPEVIFTPGSPVPEGYPSSVWVPIAPSTPQDLADTLQSDTATVADLLNLPDADSSGLDGTWTIGDNEKIKVVGTSKSGNGLTAVTVEHPSGQFRLPADAKLNDLQLTRLGGLPGGTVFTPKGLDAGQHWFRVVPTAEHDNLTYLTSLGTHEHGDSWTLPADLPSADARVLTTVMPGTNLAGQVDEGSMFYWGNRHWRVVEKSPLKLTLQDQNSGMMFRYPNGGKTKNVVLGELPDATLKSLPEGVQFKRSGDKNWLWVTSKDSNYMNVTSGSLAAESGMSFHESKSFENVAAVLANATPAVPNVPEPDDGTKPAFEPDTLWQTAPGQYFSGPNNSTMLVDSIDPKNKIAFVKLDEPGAEPFPVSMDLHPSQISLPIPSPATVGELGNDDEFQGGDGLYQVIGKVSGGDVVVVNNKDKNTLHSVLATTSPGDVTLDLTATLPTDTSAPPPAPEAEAGPEKTAEELSMGDIFTPVISSFAGEKMVVTGYNADTGGVWAKLVGEPEQEAMGWEPNEPVRDWVDEPPDGWVEASAWEVIENPLDFDGQIYIPSGSDGVPEEVTSQKLWITGDTYDVRYQAPDGGDYPLPGNTTIWAKPSASHPDVPQPSEDDWKSNPVTWAYYGESRPGDVDYSEQGEPDIYLSEFPPEDESGVPTPGVEILGNLPDGAVAEDKNGWKVVVLSQGPTQGSTTVVDADGIVYTAVVDTRLKPVGMAAEWDGPVEDTNDNASTAPPETVPTMPKVTPEQIVHMDTGEEGAFTAADLYVQLQDFGLIPALNNHDEIDGYKSNYGSGGKYKHHRLRGLFKGTQFRDKSGHIFTLLTTSGAAPKDKEPEWLVVYDHNLGAPLRISDLTRVRLLDE